ncbi:hypothetical protein BDF22DRAFT_300947 [Syncephalis plumigaleata]|nr:hypothetical protein BDF22DRAFT_300947 [Syncephalis plumigaleata]
MGKILLGILAGLLGIGVTIYIFRVARQAVQAADEEIAERGYMPGEAYPMESTIWQLGSSDDGGDRTEGTSKRSSKTVKNAKKSILKRTIIETLRARTSIMKKQTTTTTTMMMMTGDGSNYYGLYVERSY